MLQRQLERRAVTLLQQIEHGSILLVEQKASEVHLIVGRHTDEILIERTVMDGAETEPVRTDAMPSSVASAAMCAA